MTRLLFDREVGLSVFFLDEYSRADPYVVEASFYLVMGRKLPLRRRIAWRLRRLFRIIRTVWRITQ